MITKKTVTVFGAGVTGLTAAHELVVRGFDVTVIAPEINECIRGDTLDYGIGGVARSQFFCEAEDPVPGKLTRLTPSEEFCFDQTLVFEPETTNFKQGDATQQWFVRAKKVISNLRARSLLSVAQLFFATDDWTKEGDPKRLATQRRDVVCKELGLSPEEVPSVTFFQNAEDDQLDWAWFNVTFGVLPGEHGFRFFPSFYRHLIDTMQRTPILDPRPSEVGRSTVSDNLIPVDELGFARSGSKKSFLLPRRPVKSFEEVRRYLRLVRDQLAYTDEDLMRFEAKMFKYMTSCPARRAAEYEDQSWSSFMDVASYSKVFRTHLERGPAMMVGLRGSESDTRTQGTIATQLMMNWVVDGLRPDATLDGPTSGAWFDHWYTFLADQGVHFIRASLEAFVGQQGAGLILAKIRTSAGSETTISSDYVIVALSLDKVAPLTESLRKAADDSGLELPQDNDLARIDKFVVANLPEEMTKATPTGSLRHLSGIQFYFDTEVSFWRGHTQYLDSPWGLTSIAQPQFWARRRDPRDYYRGLLSVDIGVWDQPYGKWAAAWNLESHDVAEAVWAQIKDHHDDAFRAQYGKDAPFPTPVAYALDIHIEWDSKPKRDLTPFLVTEAGQFPKRPGELSDGRERPKGQSSYRPIGNLVLAGTYMKTFTRITCMEAANESARHAVNRVLDLSQLACDRCEIWDPEDMELADLQWFRDLDAELFRRERPHFVDTLGWDALPAMFGSADLRRQLEVGGLR